MKKLLSLPPNLVEPFHEVTGLDAEEYFCTCDPVGHRWGTVLGAVAEQRGFYRPVSNMTVQRLSTTGWPQRSAY